MTTGVRVGGRGWPALLVLAVGLASGGSAGARSLSFDERVAAQRAIEQVYWSHRIWPAENPTPKPPLSAVMSDPTLRARVEDTLRKSNALEVWWQRPVTPAQLQAEMERMAAQSRDPGMLRELFAALGDDPFLIAETLARQTLVDRLIRSWYANDERFHGKLADRARAALRTCRAAACMREMGGEYRETTWALRREGELAAQHGPDERILLDPEEWREQRDRWSRAHGAADSVSVSTLSALEESAEGFVVTSVLEQDEGEVTIASVTWPKVRFDTWWNAERGNLDAQIEERQGSFSLPALGASGCAADTWAPMANRSYPTPAYVHTAVWTGSEMIVWGGIGFNTPPPTGGRYSPATDTWSPIAAAPDTRARHAAVWTGTVMVVWGGLDNVALNTGGRYDPVSDTWAPTAVGDGVPEPRFAHTAVWTGSTMIVWGGFGGGGPVNTGGRYDPVTDTWSPTSTGPGNPTPRHAHTAVWTGSEMIVWGGESLLDTGGRYSPTTDTWSPTSTGPGTPAPRSYHTAVWTGSEMIVWGGNVEAGVTNTGGRYLPTSDAWSATSTGPDTPAPRRSHTAVWTGSEMIVWGGGAFSEYFDSGGRYDPLEDSWTPTSVSSNVPSARQGHTAVWTDSEMIVWGGGDGWLRTGGRYAPATDTWLPTSLGVEVPMSLDASAVWTGSEMIVWGGRTGFLVVNGGGRYAPSTDTWTSTSAPSFYLAPRFDHTAVWTGSEMIVWGGDDGNNGPISSGGRYDPSTDSWLPTGLGQPRQRVDHSAVWTGTEMIVWGGTDHLDQVIHSGGRYDPKTDSWLPTSTGSGVPTARTSHAAVWTRSEMIVWGGAGNMGALNTGGRYDPTTDSWLPTSTEPGVPSPRSHHTLVWTDSEMIVWGGEGDGDLLDTLNTGGRYDPSSDTWLPTSTVDVPDRRTYHSAVWTGAEMIVWGGLTGVAVQTGGRYDPSSDTWLPTSIGDYVPSPRFAHRAVWTGTEMIVWSGEDSSTSGDGGRYCACPSGVQYLQDADGDGYGTAGVFTLSCDGTIGPGQTAIGGDCDETNAAIHPDAPEICNGIDDDCDGGIDEDAVGPDSDADGVADCVETCPADPNKLAPGVCGCGVADSDADADGQADCVDGCPADPAQKLAGIFGSEFQVNTYTPSQQGFPAVARLGEGTFVAVWTSVGQDGSLAGVYGRRFDVEGNALGDEFRVNDFTPSIQTSPAVAAHDGVGFVVAWTSLDQDGFGLGVFARRYDPAGQPLGDELQVNVEAVDAQRVASVALAETGHFVVVWESVGQDGSGAGIYARIFDETGQPLGGEFRINGSTQGDQSVPAVAYVGPDEFVVVWHGARFGGADRAAFGRRFDAAGQALGDEFFLGTSPLNECCVDVARNPLGGWVAVWERQSGDGSGSAVFARRFDGTGAPTGSEFLVNTHTSGDQALPAVAMDAAGNFVALWGSSPQDGSGYGVFGQRFDAADDALEGEFRLNEYTSLDQAFPAVAANGAGQFLAAWHSNGQDGSSYGIFARRGVIDGDLDDDGEFDCGGPCLDTPPDQCCQPTDGALLAIDDTDECTLDVCALDGSVSHLPALPEPVGPTLRLERMEAGTVLSWSPDSGTSWNVYRGAIVAGEPWAYDETCFAAGLALPETMDADVPSAGAAFYYLVGAVDACGESAIGEPSDGEAHFAVPGCVVPRVP